MHTSADVPLCGAALLLQTFTRISADVIEATVMWFAHAACVQVVSAKERLKRASPVSAKEEVTNATLDLLLAARQRLRPISARQDSSSSAGVSPRRVLDGTVASQRHFPREGGALLPYIELSCLRLPWMHVYETS